MPAKPRGGGLTVAVTGPTGEIGRPLLAALERSDKVARVIGMARRPFDPAAHGWSKVEYRQGGDVLDQASLDALVEGTDVVVHLAFIIFGDREEARRTNLQGSRNVFEAAVAAGVKRLVYTSSIAAYGFHPDQMVLTEDVEPRGTEDFYYSAQKAELETLLRDVVDGTGTDVYIFRPSIVAGPTAPLLIEKIASTFKIGGRFPIEREMVRAIPGAKPILPDPGVPIQLVHQDDCAEALVAAIEGRGAPGTYNLAGPGTITLSDVARGVGWAPLPIPHTALRATSRIIGALGDLLPQDLAWAHGLRHAVQLDTTKAERELGWCPSRDAGETLAETVKGARSAGVV